MNRMHSTIIPAITISLADAAILFGSIDIALINRKLQLDSAILGAGLRLQLSPCYGFSDSYSLRFVPSVGEETAKANEKRNC